MKWQFNAQSQSTYSARIPLDISDKLPALLVETDNLVDIRVSHEHRELYIGPDFTNGGFVIVGGILWKKGSATGVKRN